jgi:hypothetical protein
VRIRYLANVGQIGGKQLFQHFVPVLLSLIVPITLTIVSERMFNAHPAMRLVTSGCIFAVSYGVITMVGRPGLILRIRKTLSEFRRPLRVVPAIPK